MSSTVDPLSSPIGDVKPAASSPAVANASNAVSPDTKSPWDHFMANVDALIQAKNDASDQKDKHSKWILCDFHQVLVKLGYLEDDCEDLDDYTREERRAAFDKLTEEQIEEHVQIAILPDSVAHLREDIWRAVMNSDPRNEEYPDQCVWMFSTYSSVCMVQVIDLKLTAAVKEVNKAVKICSADPTKEIPGVAVHAAKVAIATIMGVTDCDHYRCDTEDDDSINRILQRIGKLLKDLFWFTDAELGWSNDSMTRKALIKNFEDMANKWRDDAEGLGYEKDFVKPMKFKCPKNQQGMGRSVAASEKPALSNPRPAKKPKVASLAPITHSGQKSLTSFFSDISNKLSLRVKTLMQVKIVSLSDPNKCEYVVVSGATSMKKLGHMVAFVTGCTNDYHYHTLKGKSLPESRFELSVTGYKTCWIAPQKETKLAAAACADAVIDTSIKVVQVFQGLNCEPCKEMKYDSELAKQIIEDNRALVFAVGDDEKKRYAVSVMAIAASKCFKDGHLPPMPRIVTYDENQQQKTGFGKTFKKAMSTLLVDRTVRLGCLVGDWSLEDQRDCKRQIWSAPICRLDGTGVCMSDAGRSDFAPGDVASASPPEDY